MPTTCPASLIRRLLATVRCSIDVWEGATNPNTFEEVRGHECTPSMIKTYHYHTRQTYTHIPIVSMMICCIIYIPDKRVWPLKIIYMYFAWGMTCFSKMLCILSLLLSLSSSSPPPPPIFIFISQLFLLKKYTAITNTDTCTRYEVLIIWCYSSFMSVIEIQQPSYIIPVPRV